MAILKGELQTNNGDVLHPHTSASVVFGKDGKSVEEQIDVLNGRVVTGVENKVSETNKTIHDLNIPTKTDLYFYTDNSDTTRKNAPDVWGGVLFHKQIDVGYCFQTAESLSGTTYTRMQHNGAWGEWEDKIGNLSDKSLIPRGYYDNKDMNDLKTQGSYLCIPNCTNIPPVTVWGTVNVYLGGTGSITQEWVFGDKNFPTRKFIRHFDGNGWTVWQELATTNKINILLTPDAGYTITYQSNIQINNVIYYNLTMKRTDGGDFAINTSLPCFSIPNGKIAYDATFTCIGADASQYNKAVFCVVSANTLKCYIVVKDTGTKEIKISGTVVI